MKTLEVLSYLGVLCLLSKPLALGCAALLLYWHHVDCRTLPRIPSVCRARAEHAPSTRRARAEHAPSTRRARAEHAPSTRRARAEHAPSTRRARAEHAPST